MKILSSVFRHLYRGTFISALRHQPEKYLRKRWEKFLNGNKESVVFILKGGIKIKLYKDSQLSQYIFQKRYEKEEILFISEYLKKDDYFIDIGTNIGLFSLIGSKKVKQNGKIFSYEPTLKNFERLQENIKLNKIKNIETIKKAVSDENGFLDINVSLEGYDAWNSFAKPFWWKNYTTERVETIILDDIFGQNIDCKKVKLIKIDVEGWELFVIKGGEKYLSLKDAPTLIIEFVEENTRNAGYGTKEVYKLLIKYGYELYRLEGRKIILEEQREFYINENLIATKNLEQLVLNLPKWIIKN